MFGHCVGFDTVADAATFQNYILRCQVETTMPFNDYWITPPPLTSLKTVLIGTVVALAVIELALFGGLVASGWSCLGAALLAMLALLV